MNMIERLLKLKDDVLEVLEDEAVNHKLTLPSEADWNKLAGLHAILLPLEQATKLLGGENYSSCSVLLPLLCHLLHSMQANDDDPGYISRFKSMFYADLEPRKQMLMKKAFLLHSTALDPRFKLLKFLSRDSRTEV